MQTSSYLIVMAIAAGISLVRGFAVASVLLPEEFASYAIAVALGTFLSNFLSFGLIESTIKQFPRLTAAGAAESLLPLAHSVVVRLTKRAALTLPVFLIAGLCIGGQYAEAAVAVLFVGYGVAVTSVAASLQRALLDTKYVALGTSVRALTALLLAVLGAVAFGFEGAIAGEVCGALLGAAASRSIASRTVAESAGRFAVANFKPKEVRAERGITLFAAYSAVAAPAYFDRAYVAAVFTQAETSSYALMGLLLTGASVLVNIVGQKVGPQLIRDQSAGISASQLAKLAMRWSIAVIGLWVMAVGCVALGIFFGPVADLFAKYEVSSSLLIAIAGLGCVQVSALFEFILVANDMERTFLALASGYLCLVGVIAAAVPVAGVSLVGFIVLLAIAKLIYLAALLLLLCRTPPRAEGVPSS